MEHTDAAPAYGLWGLAIINAAVFIMFAFSIFKPKTKVAMYVRLAHREEREVAAEFGAAWDVYAAATPRWLPRLSGAATVGTYGAGGRR